VSFSLIFLMSYHECCVLSILHLGQSVNSPGSSTWSEGEEKGWLVRWGRSGNEFIDPTLRPWRSRSGKSHLSKWGQPGNKMLGHSPRLESTLEDVWAWRIRSLTFLVGFGVADELFSLDDECPWDKLSKLFSSPVKLNPFPSTQQQASFYSSLTNT